MRSTAYLLLFSVVGLSAGCASIISDGEYPVTFNSHPSGASVTVTDENGVEVEHDVTPFTTTLSASNGYFNRMEYSVTYKMPCYTPVTAPLAGGIDGWYWGNIVFGGVIGMLIVDPATGAMYTVARDSSVTLERTAGTACVATTSAEPDDADLLTTK